jgi:DNA-directed RNA polymerase subunit RPC12/RpoP
MKTKSNKKQLKYKCSKCGEQFTTLKDGICYSWCEGRVIPNKLFKAKAMEKPRCHEIKGIGGKVGFDKKG